MTFLADQDLIESIEQASRILPAQGPIGVFVHHNTLHAFEALPFEEATAQAGEILDCQPYMPEEWYREQIQQGRISDVDLENVVATRTAAAQLTPTLSLAQLRLALLRYPLHCVDGPPLRWHLNETGALWRFRKEIEAPQRQRLLQDTLDWSGAAAAGYSEKIAVQALWDCSQQALEQLDLSAFQAPPVRPFVRHRDYLLEAGALDVDALVDPFLIRFCAAFLDQGVADVSMPGRQRGLYRCFLEIYARPGGMLPHWLQGLREALGGMQGLSAIQSVQESLRVLGVTRAELAEFVRDTLLVLKGWAGMIHQAHLRPDRLPAEPVPAQLMDYLAVRLLLERFACLRLLQTTPYQGLTLAQLRSRIPVALADPPSRLSLAFQLHQVCQFLGLHPGVVEALTGDQLLLLLKSIQDFPSLERRKLLHLAYERHFRLATLDALHLHRPAQRAPLPVKFQAIFCIDEREESTRRHLEEVEPLCETYGTPGYFSIPMYFKALQEPHPVALCPVAITPTHLIEEVLNPSSEEEAARRSALRRSLSHVANRVEVGSKSLAWGSLLTSGLGLVSALPAMIRVLSPRWAGRMERRLRRTLCSSDTHLEIERSPAQGKAADGLFHGFTVAEMTEIVACELENIGLREQFAPLVLVIGHGSSSLNNPHEAAYDCGACGGGRGGPNARTLAWMANHPEVRSLLNRRGVTVPASTRFVGAYHNTCAEDIELYDLKDLDAAQLSQLEVAVAALQEARGRDALERCRRFVSASFDLTPRQALLHVEERAADLAQPRPECGHATNAVCLIGRRARTRGLFMDRRAFLASYDPLQDDAEGTILARLLRAVGPVGAGISLEYYFSSVDNRGYGSGSKLPHNVTGLIGVMDGYSSDLRTGLPRQMVEIHEPLRLLTVVEARLPVVESVLNREDGLRRLFLNGWVQLALLDPDSQQIQVLEGQNWVAHRCLSAALPIAADSTEWFHHHRESLEFAEILPAAPEFSC